ncbi:hypothetical protein ACFPC0_14270 [Streptomyces andamanensis]|uniref:Uncharacterized protein n=1 Tax=Streptomyces andamanensis TaxID=1565035 RepID=A0ABV8TE81_9ACTN
MGDAPDPAVEEPADDGFLPHLTDDDPLGTDDDPLRVGDFAAHQQDGAAEILMTP